MSAVPSPKNDDAAVETPTDSPTDTANDAPPRTADDAELRAAIRRLGDLLGQTLVRQHGPELLEQVEAIRALGKQGADVSELLAAVDPEQAIKLVRAFTTYFHLANVAEQVHRGRELAATRAAEGGLAGARRSTGSRPRAWPARPPSGVAPVGPPGLHRAPDRGRAPHRADQAPPGRRAARERDRTDRVDRRRAPCWPRPSSCCGRPTSCASPGPSRSTRRATPSTTSTSCTRDAVAGRARGAGGGAAAPRRRAAASARAADVRHLDRRRPRRQPERHAADDARRARAPARARDPRPRWRPIDALRESCPPPCGSPAPDRGARASLDADLEALPEIRPALPADQRRGAVPPQAHVHPAEAVNTRRRIAAGTPARAAAATTSAPPSCSTT